MSLTTNGQYILCDGDGCQVMARVPVALRPLLTGNGVGSRRAEGWLYVVGANGCLHYCPHCAQRYLERLMRAARS